MTRFPVPACFATTARPWPARAWMAMIVAGLLAWPLYLSMLLTTSSAFSGERERATWDAILTSSLADREIVTGKLWGSVWEVRWWLAAIVLCFVQGAVSAMITSESLFLDTNIFGLGAIDRTGGWSLGRALMGVLVVFTGSMFGGRGVVGVTGEILFLLGVGLRTSLGCRTSGKSLGITLLIWIGSGMAFKIIAYMGYIAYFVLSSAGMNRYSFVPAWLARTGQVLGMQIVWFGPLASGMFWIAVGLWLIRRTIREFDALATRMQGGEVKMLPAVGTAESEVSSLPVDLATDAAGSSAHSR
jgi:hypothetical protein